MQDAQLLLTQIQDENTRKNLESLLKISSDMYSDKLKLLIIMQRMYKSSADKSKEEVGIYDIAMQNIEDSINSIEIEYVKREMLKAYNFVKKVINDNYELYSMKKVISKQATLELVYEADWYKKLVSGELPIDLGFNF